MASGVPASGVTEPSNSTFNQLKSRVAASVGMGGQQRALDLAGDGINNGIRRVNSKLWSWLLTTADITTVADQANYNEDDSVPGDFKAPRSMLLLDSSSNESSRLVWLLPKDFDNLWLDRRNSGEPRTYTVHNIHDNRTLSLSAAPTAKWVAAYPTMRLRYYKRLGLYSGNETTQIPVEAELMIEYFARAEVASVVRPGALSRYESMWRDQERELRSAEMRWQVGDFD